MRNSVFSYNVSTLQKICLSGMFIALVIILQKVIAINYIPVMPFVRVSPGGPALIIFSSIFLGPICGLVIGVSSDLLGYLIFDPKTMGLFPQITAIYGLLGFASYFVFWGFKYLKNKKVALIIESLVLLVLAIGSSLFFILNDSITLYSSTYYLELWQKITLPITIFALFILLFLVIFLIDRKNKSEETLNIWQISLSCFVLEIIVMVLFGSLMKSWAFNFNFFIIAICQVIVLFINVPLNTFLLATFMRLTKRFKKE